MTTDLATALLRNAIISGMRIATETPIEQVPAAIADVLAALSRAFDPALTERAGEVLSRLRKADEYEPLGHDGWEAADLITALLAQNAALRAERDALAEEVKQSDAMLVAEANASLERLARAEAAEAQITTLTARVERLTGALRDIEADCDADYPPSHGAIKQAARAALTTEART